MRTSARLRFALVAAGTSALVVTLVACTAQPSGGSAGPVVTKTTIVGTSTVTSTSHTNVATFTLASSPTASPTTSSRASTSALPAAQVGECPYLSAGDVQDINGQHHGPTSIIPVKPYPTCVFTRSDGSYLATTRIYRAADATAATAILDTYAPVDESFPVSSPAGWSGGAMTLPSGNADNAGNHSVYAVSKGPIVIVAESNQAQSIKGRQMVEQIVANMGW